MNNTSQPDSSPTPSSFTIPLINLNVEGLRLHSFTATLFSNEKITDTERKWRSWLVHCLVKSSRHFTAARKLALSQYGSLELPEHERAPNGAFPIFNFPFEIEDCVTSLYKAIQCIKALAKKDQRLDTYFSNMEEMVEALSKFRNQQDHLQTQLASGQTGDGPILAKLSDDGKSVQIRDCHLSIETIIALIAELYRATSSLYPFFEPNSTPQREGIPQLSITMDVRTIESSEK